MIKKILLLSAAATIFFAPACVMAEDTPALPKTGAPKEIAEPLTQELMIFSLKHRKRYLFHVEVANTPETREKGLMFRTEMPEDRGMLFLFETPGERSFWMKNTLIPLDIVFISKDGIIKNIGHGKPQDLTGVKSDGEVLHVLELNGGLAEKLGIAPGDAVLHPAFYPPEEPKTEVPAKEETKKEDGEAKP